MSAHAPDEAAAVRGLTQMADSPGLVLGAGALSILIGVLVLAWPGATIVVIAWLFAVQLLVAGVLQLVSGFSADRGPGFLWYRGRSRTRRRPLGRATGMSHRVGSPPERAESAC